MAEMRRCIGSAKFGIAAHEAPVGDFPVQPSQKDGLGRMCKRHWREYTNALRKAALARKAEQETPAKPERAKAAIKRVPKLAKKAARGQKKEVETVETVDVDDAAFGRERNAELARAAQASDAAKEEATVA